MKAFAQKNQSLLHCAFLILVFWSVRYAHLGGYGLYEDDLALIPNAIQMSQGELFRYIGDYIINLHGHARPLSNSLVYLFSNWGWHLGRLSGPYWLAFALQSLNLCLFYSLLRRAAALFSHPQHRNSAPIPPSKARHPSNVRAGEGCSPPPHSDGEGSHSLAESRLSAQAFPLFGGLAYALFSADTTQVFLSVSLGMHQSLTLLLLAGHAYLSNKRLLSYLLAGTILFAYETPFLVLVGIPLLRKKWNRALLKEWIGHALILLGMLAAVFLLRRGLGDGRVSGLSTEEMLVTPFLHILQGPPVSLGSYLLRPLQALLAIAQGGALAFEVALASLAGLVVFSWVFANIQEDGQNDHLYGSLTPSPSPKGKGEDYNPSPLGEGLRVRVSGSETLRLALAGLVMLAAAYPLTFTVRAYAITGRDTRVHAAAVVGAAILVGALFSALFDWLHCLQSAQVHPPTRAPFALFTRCAPFVFLASLPALLLGYGFVIQADYTLAWQLQQRFWSGLTPLIADVEPGTIILIEPSGLQDTRQIGANTWNLPVVIEKSYEFPPGWGATPRAVRLQPGWQERIVLAPDVFWLNAATVEAPETYYQQVDTFQIIFITTTGGKLQRQFTPLILNGVEYPLKGQGTARLPPLCQQDCIPPGFLSTLLIQTLK